MPNPIDSHLSLTAWRKKGARLIQKIYQVDPLLLDSAIDPYAALWYHIPEKTNSYHFLSLRY
jgi:hypothetical protein